MDKTLLEKALLKVKSGNELERERLIKHYKPYVINTVGHICKRYVTWSSDEASIGLIAFNRAIDTFEFDKGRTFLNYVYLLINRDLIDYFRKQDNKYHLSVDPILKDDSLDSSVEIKASMESYEQSIQTTSLVEEILELDQLLNKFKISFDELEKHSPKHQDTRVQLLRMTLDFIQHDNLIADLLKRNVFPVKAFSKLTGYRPKTIERHRKYLITTILIKLHPEWVHLTSFVQVGPGSEINGK